MPLLKTLIGLPVLVVVLVFAFVNNDLATFSLWPFALRLRFRSAWPLSFSSLSAFFSETCFLDVLCPVRKALRQHKKQCKKLNKEQQKLVREMEGLHEDLENIQSQRGSGAKTNLWRKNEKLV